MTLFNHHEPLRVLWRLQLLGNGMEASLQPREARAFDMSERIAQDHLDLHGEAEASDESDTSWNRHCKDCIPGALGRPDTDEVVPLSTLGAKASSALDDETCPMLNVHCPHTQP